MRQLENWINEAIKAANLLQADANENGDGPELRRVINHLTEAKGIVALLPTEPQYSKP